MEEFENRMIAPYEIYVEEDEYALPAEYNFAEFFSSVTLVSLDEIFIQDEYRNILYVNFYHPGEITPEGFDVYICSTEFGAAFEYLENLTLPIVWHNYINEDWKWLNEYLFKSDYESSSKMAFDILTNVYTHQLSDNLAPGITLVNIDETLSKNLSNIHVILPEDIYPRGSIYYIDDSITQFLATFQLEDLKFSQQDQILLIKSITSALLAKDYETMGEPKQISKNGAFKPPLTGTDNLSKKASKKVSYSASPFDEDQMFTMVKIDRINRNDSTFPSNLPIFLYEAVRNGEIPIFRNDSLDSRKLTGEFFDAMLYEDQKSSKMLDPKVLKTHLMVTETIFDRKGRIRRKNPLGVGLIVPGNLVPEGFNRDVGYFRVEDINKLLTISGRDTINFSRIRGFPIKSWNIETYEVN